MKKIILAILLVNLSVSLTAKEIDLSKSKGTNQKVISSLSPSPMDTTVKRGANIKITFAKKLKQKKLQKSIKLKYLGCKQEKEQRLKEKRQERIQRCEKKYKHNKHLRKSCKQCARSLFKYQNKRVCKPKNIKGKTTYLKQKNILKFNPLYKLKPGYYQVTVKGLKSKDNQKIKKIMYRFEVSKNSIESITLAQNAITLKEGESIKLTLQATYKDGTTEDITQDINWIVGDTTIATIDTNANLKALKEGETLIQAQYHGIVSQEVKVTVRKNAEVINGYTLPPEPDPKINNATLLGVDSNNNGVRDDVERWIVKTFEHGGFRNNLYLTDRFLKTAKNYQKRLANEDPTPEEVLKLYKEDDDNDHCLWELTGKENKNYATERRKLKDKVFNTHKRLELFFLYEKRLPMREYYKYRLFGGTLNELDAREKACIEEYLNFKGDK